MGRVNRRSRFAGRWNGRSGRCRSSEHSNGYDLRVDTLANIAQAQMKLGDRATALATLKMAYESIDRSKQRRATSRFSVP